MAAINNKISINSKVMPLANIACIILAVPLCGLEDNILKFYIIFITVHSSVIDLSAVVV